MSAQITSVLVANRGEIARRIFRTCRLLGLRTVAVYSDADAGAPFVGEADVAVGLGGMSAADSYLRGDAIIAAARASGADAIHPGYGFLSENAGFATAVVEAGLRWIGPTPANIAAMGTKVEAKALAAAAGVPTLPSALVGAEPSGWESAAVSVGFPLLVKASAGGGGKGMRAVTSVEQLHEAIIGAQREAVSSFGDGTVFLERLLVRPRHIEVQIFGDTHGNVVHLFERECSIQRRHQKIVEEAPSPAVDPALRAAMGAASVELAQSIGYVGAGTVEYLLGEDGTFAFLEMNTRLQVEHPVTECVTRTDLVRWQIDVANGLRLPLRQDEITCEGHAIEVRLYAEDPADGYAPSVGTLHRFVPAGTKGVRWDSGVESGSVVSPHYDPMLAKVIAHAPTRAQAAGMLRREMLGTVVHGVRTNAASLAAIMGDTAYLAADTTTAYLDERPEVLRPAPVGSAAARAAAILAQRARRSRLADGRWGFAPSGFRNLPTQRQHLVMQGYNPADRVRLDYQVSGDRVVWSHDGGEHEAVVGLNPNGSWLVAVDRVSETVWVHMTEGADEERWWANSPSGQTELTVLPRFVVPSAVVAGAGTTAPVPGRVVAVQVSVGDAVVEGQVLVVLEAMKMEHSIRAAAAATVAEVRVGVGDQVDARQVLVVLT